MTAKTAHQFEISVSDLDAAGRSYRFPIPAVWMRGALEDSEATPAGPDGELDVRVSKSGTDVVVHGTMKAEVTVPCARCLAPVKVRISQPISALMVPRSALGRPGDDEYEFSADEADTLPYEGDLVVLDDLVRDELLLEMPMIPLCSEDCPGMSRAGESSPEAGAAKPSKPVDPRLAPLMKFKPGKNDKS